MRLITYLFAAALLWAVASSGPSTPSTASDAGRAEQAAAPPGSRLAAYPR